MFRRWVRDWAETKTVKPIRSVAELDAALRPKVIARERLCHLPDGAYFCSDCVARHREDIEEALNAGVIGKDDPFRVFGWSVWRADAEGESDECSHCERQPQFSVA